MKDTEYKQYTFDVMPIDLINLYETDEKMLWKYYPHKDNNCNQAINYLIAKHHIDYAILHELIQQGNLWQSSYTHTIEFPIKTERDDLVAVEAVRYDNKGCFRSKEVLNLITFFVDIYIRLYTKSIRFM